MLKSLAQKLWPNRRPRKDKALSGPQILTREADDLLLRGWQDPDIAREQEKAFAPLLHEMRAGRPRLDFEVLAKAIAATGVKDPLVVEIGCGGGWNYEVLNLLLKRPVRYQGLDYSPAMIACARRNYPGVEFTIGDAAALPFPDNACDILLSGTVLMHLANYGQAIRESRRVTRHWCVFHTVPVLQKRETTRLEKPAYGRAPVIEIIFNEEHLCRLFVEAGLVVRHTLESIPYDLKSLLGETTVTKTFVCEIQP